MLTRSQEERALSILFNLSVERKDFWNQMFRRWWISHEPLRNDAANLIREIGYQQMMPMDCHLVGDDEQGGQADV